MSLKATCFLEGSGGGVIDFEQNGDTCHLTGKVTGLKAGLHGFHIHEFGDRSSGCATTGGHFNPTSKEHGGPTDEVRHYGDLGNVMVDESGVCNVDITDKLVTLCGPNSVIGRAIVVHADEDDLGKGGHEDSKTTGHAGARLLCGVIGIKK